MSDSLGTRIRISRKDLGITQKDLAQRSGVSRSYIANLENDSTTNVGSDIILKLATALGVAPIYLMGAEDDPLYGMPEEEQEEPIEDKCTCAAAAHIITNAEEELLITIYQLLPPEKRKILLNIAKVLRDVEKLPEVNQP